MYDDWSYVVSDSSAGLGLGSDVLTPSLFGFDGLECRS